MRLILLLISITISISLYAQVPQAFSYKLQIKGNSGNLHANRKINLKISIIQGNIDGNEVYIEKHLVNTSPSGIVDIEIGRGEPILGFFSEIDWKNWPYFVKAEVDLKCTENYGLLAIAELLSVPYAMFAGNVKDNNDADADPENELQVLSISNDTVLLSRGGFIVLPSINKGNYFFCDRDGDGYGYKFEPLWIPETISPPNGFIMDMNDCNDNDAAINPLATEILDDGIDQDCDGTDSSGAYSDDDGDGFTENQGDCNDFNSTVYPGANEICNDGIDQDCNLVDLECPYDDSDGDGISDNEDNCLSFPNHDQADADKDRVGDECDICLPGETLFDINGNNYKTVTIGSQTWMAENLITTRYNDGTYIPLVTDITNWGEMKTPAYCWLYNDSITFKSVHGILYNGYAIDSIRLCPVGWHVPDNIEWTTLINNLIASGYNYDGTTAGQKIGKSIAFPGYWNSSDIIGAVGNYNNFAAKYNVSGFSAIPGGYRLHDGLFPSNPGADGYWWSATEFDANFKWYFHLEYNSASPGLFYKGFARSTGFSVRCVKTDPDLDYDNDGITINEGDCNENDNTISPNAIELYNKKDDNCNNLIDEDFICNLDKFEPNEIQENSRYLGIFSDIAADSLIVDATFTNPEDIDWYKVETVDESNYSTTDSYYLKIKLNSSSDKIVFDIYKSNNIKAEATTEYVKKGSLFYDDSDIYYIKVYPLGINKCLGTYSLLISNGNKK